MPPRLQIDVTGDAVSNHLHSPGSYLVDSGATVVLTSNIPVTWSMGSSITGASLEVIASTPTRWEGRILGQEGLFVDMIAASTEKPGTGDQALFYIR